MRCCVLHMGGLTKSSAAVSGSAPSQRQETQRSDPAHSHTEVSITRRKRRLGFRPRCLCPLPVYLCLGASARQEPNGGGWHASPRVCHWVCASPRLVLVICSLLDQAAVSTMLRGRRPQARMDPALSGTGGGGLHEAREDPAPRRLVNMTMRSTLGGGQGTRYADEATTPACQQLMIQGATVAKMKSRMPCATTSGRPSGATPGRQPLCFKPERNQTQEQTCLCLFLSIRT